MSPRNKRDSTPDIPKPEVLKWFVDRVGERNRFELALGGKERTQVMVIEGNEGIGKTSLLKYFSAQAAKKLVPAASLDFAQNDLNQVIDILQRFAVLLGPENFNTLKTVLEEGSQLKIILRKEKLTKSSKVEINAEKVTIKDSEIAGGDIIKNNIFKVDARDPRLNKIWQGKLNDAFFDDLKKLLRKKQRVVFLVDSFEQTSKEAQQWFTDQLFSRINRLDQVGNQLDLRGVIVAIAGERVPSYPFDWEDLLDELRLAPLPAQEVKNYLITNRGLTFSDQVLETIYELTHGEPYLVAIIADNPEGFTPGIDQDKLLEILVKGILSTSTLNPSISKILLLAAVSDWCSQPLLDELAGVEKIPPAKLVDILRFSFVSQEENNQEARVRIKPAVRSVLRKELLKQPEKWQALQRAAAEFFDHKAKEAQKSSPQEFQAFEVLAVAHTLIIDEPAGRARLLQNFSAAERTYELAFCSQLLRQANEAPALSQETKNWIVYLEGLLELSSNNFIRSRELLSELLKNLLLSAELRGLANLALGQCLTKLGIWKDALKCLEKAHTILTGIGKPEQLSQLYLALGDLHLVQARALGELVQPISTRGRSGWQMFQVLLVLLVSLPMALFAWINSRWQLLSPWGHLMDYRNWRLIHLFLSALNWFQAARTTFVQSEDIDSECLARQNIATVYYCLGARKLALDEFKRLLAEPVVNDHPYRLAMINMAYCDCLVSPGYDDEALEKAYDGIKDSLEAFQKLGDQQAQAEASMILAQACLLRGETKTGLESYLASLDLYDAIKDRLGAGKALDGLRRWGQKGTQFAGQQDVLKLIADRPNKTYLFRVPDRMVLILQVAITSSLLLGFLSIVIWIGLVFLKPFSELVVLLSQPVFYIRILLQLIGILWVIVILYGLVGFGLILLGTRRQLKPEHLGGITTDPERIYKINYQNEEAKHLSWQDIHTLISNETRIGHDPFTILSYVYLCSHQDKLLVPATMLWYADLKEDIQNHLKENEVPTTRLNLDFTAFNPWFVGLLLAGLLCLGLNQVITANQQPFPLSAQVAAWASPLLMFVGLAAAIAGPYWWVIRPLSIRYFLVPESRAPWLAGFCGLVIICLAFYIDLRQPYYPIRNWLDGALHPLGFILLGCSLIWLIKARHWKEFPLQPGEPVYSLGIRLAAGAGMIMLSGLSCLFAWRQLIPYFPIYQGITYYYHESYQETIDRMSTALDYNANLADGYMFRALAYEKLGQYSTALDDLNRLVEGPGIKMAYYYYYRARTLNELGQVQTACADLQASFSASRWRLSPGVYQRAKNLWQEWGCGSP